MSSLIRAGSARLAFGPAPPALLPEPAPLPGWVVDLGGLAALLVLGAVCWNPRLRRREVLLRTLAGHCHGASTRATRHCFS